MTDTSDKRNAKEKPEIIIDLDNSMDAHAFDKPNEIIQQRAMRDFFGHIHESMGKIGAFTERLFRQREMVQTRFHDTIMLSGERGSGKTTFLLNMFHLIKTNKVDGATGNKDHSIISDQNIANLGIIDPTLNEKQERVFIEIIALIKDIVDECYHSSSPNDPYSSGQNKRSSHGQEWQKDVSISDREYQDWLDSLKILAAGLTTLDGVGHDEMSSDGWQDPSHVMERGLRNVLSGGSNLVSNFHIYIDRSLKLLKKKAFILVFDDIDTHFGSGWPVLEVIRKYLTTPQLITILSGNLQLYSTLIRGKQWDNFSERQLRQEISSQDKSAQREKVDTLVKEYLLKIFKPDRRITIRSIGQCLEEYSITVKSMGMEADDQGNKQLDLDSLLIDFFNKGLGLTVYDNLLLIKNHILNGSTRMIVQLLSAFVVKSRNGDDVALLHNSLVDLFITTFKADGLNSDFLRKPDPNLVLDKLLFVLTEQNNQLQGLHLRPDYTDQEAASRMIVVGAIIARLMKDHPALYFDYFIKISMTREIARWLPIKPANPEEELGPSLNGYLEYVGLRHSSEFSVQPARYSGGYQYAYFEHLESEAHLHNNKIRVSGGGRPLKFNKTPRTTWRGSVYLMAPGYGGEKAAGVLGSDEAKLGLSNLYSCSDEIAEEKDGKKVFSSIEGACDKYPLEFLNAIRKHALLKDKLANKNIGYFNRIGTLSQSITTWHNSFVDMPTSIFIKQNNEKIPIFSILPLLNTIGVSLQAADVKKTGKNMQGSYLSSGIDQASSFSPAYLPAWRDKFLASSRLIEEEEEGAPQTKTKKENNSDDGEKKYYKLLEQWVENETDSLGIMPVFVVSSIWTRFFNALGKIDALPREEKYLGNLFHKMIVAFLNAALVQEQIHWGRIDTVSLKDPGITDAIFDQNLNKIQENDIKKTAPFFYWLASCPLWAMYLNPKKSQIFELVLKEAEINREDLKPGYADSEKVFDNLFVPLNSVLVVKKKVSSSKVAFVVNSTEKEKMLCLECGKKYNLLSQHVLKTHKMEFSEYTKKYDLPDDYPKTIQQKIKQDKLAQEAKIAKQSKNADDSAGQITVPAQEDEYKHDVYLSCSLRDHSVIQELAERLKGDGLRVWTEEQVILPGDDINLGIEQGLEQSRVTVLIISPSSYADDSARVKKERNIVISRDPSNQQRRFIPLLLANCNIPDSLRSFSFIDYRDENETEYQKLLKVCKR